MCFWGSAQAAGCAAESGSHTAALVELYTAQSCSSCPPADRWLSSLGARGGAPGRLVPIALHVDYWDYIDGKDPYAKRLSLRQRKLTQRQRLALVYTPQVMLQGRDFRAWGRPAFEEAVSRINARPAAATIKVRIAAIDAGGMVVRALAEVHDAQHRSDAALYLAGFESRLESRVNLVLEWRGPVVLSAGMLQGEHRVPLLPGAVPTNSGVVAFVQNRRTAEVLQALMLPACR